jgi:hypothetical protein
MSNLPFGAGDCGISEPWVAGFVPYERCNMFLGGSELVKAAIDMKHSGARPSMALRSLPFPVVNFCSA